MYMGKKNGWKRYASELRSRAVEARLVDEGWQK